MNWKETWSLRKEPNQWQNAYMDFMSVCGLITASIVSAAPFISIVLVFIQFVK